MIVNTPQRRHAAWLFVFLSIGLVFAAGCKEAEKPLSDVVHTEMRPWIDQVDSAGTSWFDPPGTLTIQFGNAWSDLPEEDQRGFMIATGEKWVEMAVDHEVTKPSKVKVIFEDDEGERLGLYQAGKGLE